MSLEGQLVISQNVSDIKMFDVGISNKMMEDVGHA